MKKRLLVVAIAGAFAASGAAMAQGPAVSVSGWGESIFTVMDDFGEDDGLAADGSSANSTERKFATDGELDFMATINDNLSARADIDINNSLAKNNDDLAVEQLFVNWKATDMFGIKIGRFNNPVGYEGQDATDIATVTNSLLFSAIQSQVARTPDGYNNNLEGLALDFTAGPAMVTLGVVNEIGGIDEENSFFANIGGSFAGFDIEAGILTQDDNDTSNLDSAENIIDVNAAYNFNAGVPLKIWAEWLSTGEIYDNGWTVGAYAMVSQMVGVAVRYDTLSYDANIDDNTALTVALTVRPVEHLDLLLEWRSDEFEASDLGAQTLAGGTGPAEAEDSADRLLLSAVYSF